MNWIQYGTTWTGEASKSKPQHPFTNAGNRAMGQLFMMGWEGQEVTPQIRSLIEDHHLGSIILTTKNLKCRFKNLGSLVLIHGSDRLPQAISRRKLYISVIPFSGCSCPNDNKSGSIFAMASFVSSPAEVEILPLAY